MLLLQLATWFHDTGYSEGPEEHEERSCVNAENFLKGKIPDADLEIVKGCIRSTKVPQRPTSILEQIICDADLSHLGMGPGKVAVYFPHSFAWSGNLLIVPSENVVALDARPADVMKFAVSGGVSQVDEEE